MEKLIISLVLFCLSLFLLNLLMGCSAVRVDVTYDSLGSPLSCHAEYSTLFKEMEAGNFAMCNGTAEILDTKVDAGLLEALIRALK